MFGLSNALIISNEMSTYIKDTTNKSLEKYKQGILFKEYNLFYKNTI